MEKIEAIKFIVEQLLEDTADDYLYKGERKAYERVLKLIDRINKIDSVETLPY